MLHSYTLICHLLFFLALINNGINKEHQNENEENKTNNKNSNLHNKM